MARNPTPLRMAIVLSGRTQREIAAEIDGIDETRLSRIVNGLQCDDRIRERIAAVLGREKTELWPEVANTSDSLFGLSYNEDAAA
jgi:hypothetical protein